MEATAEHRLDEQDWGRCFIQHEPDFAIYDAYIAGYSQALELAVAEQEILKVNWRSPTYLKSLTRLYRPYPISSTPSNYLHF